MKINYKEITNHNPLIIGETACGHNGKLENLKKLILICKRAGLKTIKFQIFTLDERSTPKSKEEKIFKNLILNEPEWKKSVKFAHKNGLFVFADIFGMKSLEIAKNSKVDGFKIHSEDTLNYPLIEKVMRLNRITIISAGGSYRSELFSLINYLKEKNLNNNLILMAGYQVFPTPFASHSLKEVYDLLKKYKKFNLKIGFSDHVKGGIEESFFLPISAISSGAEVIEKHFTINRKLKLTDHYSSMNPDELKKFVLKIKNYSKLHYPITDLSKVELKYRKMFKKYPCFKFKKKRGDIINQRDIVYRKHKIGGQSMNLENIIGKKILTDVQKDSPLNLKDIEQKVGAIIVSRMTSDRLPGKAIKKICGKEAIVILINRIKKIKKCDKIILATSTDISDDPLEEIAKREKIEIFRGSLENVALRYYEAAKKFSLDQIYRITGDAIFCDEIMLEKALESQISKCTDVTFIKNMPYGTAKEVFSFKTIELIAKYAKVGSNTEYLEWFLENKRNFNVGNIKSNYKFKKDIRLTLDFKEDLDQLNKIYSNFHSKEHVTLEEAIKYLNKNPKIINMNNHLIAKFKKTEKNTELNI